MAQGQDQINKHVRLSDIILKLKAEGAFKNYISRFWSIADPPPTLLM
jgi:hypothetical protein